MATESIDFSSMESPTPTETPQETSFEQPESTAAEPQGTPSGDQQAEESPNLDGRRGPANIRTSLKAAMEALPDQSGAFKELGNAYFREQAYKQHFAKPEEAAAAKQLIEGLGGVDGAAAMQQRIQTADLQDSLLKDGNPEVLDAIFKDFPEGAVALAPHYLERLSQANPQAFKDLVAPHAVDMLKATNLLDSLAEAYNAQDPKQIIQKLWNWAKRQIDARDQSKTAPQKNPSEDKFKAERAKLDEEREGLFSEGVAAKVNAAVTPEIQKAVDQYSRSYGLNDKQKAHFQNTLQKRLVDDMNADKTYVQQVNLRKANKGRTHDTVASYISSEFTRRLADTALNVAQEIYGAPKGRPAATGVPKADTPPQPAGGGAWKVSGQPANSDIDWSHKDAEIWFIQNKARLKSGKIVTWANKPNA